MKLVADRLVVAGQRAGRPGVRPALERRERRLGGEQPGLDRVVDALQRRHVDEPGAVAGDQQPGRVQLPRQRDEAALGDRLRAPADPLAALEDAAGRAGASSAPGAGRARRARVAVVEADDHAERDHVLAHRVDEASRRTRGSLRPPRSGQPIVWMTRSSGCATSQTSLTPSAQTCGFSPASPNRSIATPVRWPCVPSARTVTGASMSEPGSKFGERLAVAAAALVAGAHADDAAAGRRAASRRPSPAGSSRRAPRPARRASGRAATSEAT